MPVAVAFFTAVLALSLVASGWWFIQGNATVALPGGYDTSFPAVWLLWGGTVLGILACMAAPRCLNWIFTIWNLSSPSEAPNVPAEPVVERSPIDAERRPDLREAFFDGSGSGMATQRSANDDLGCLSGDSNRPRPYRGVYR